MALSINVTMTVQRFTDNSPIPDKGTVYFDGYTVKLVTF